jgi:hypothetical protein
MIISIYAYVHKYVYLHIFMDRIICKYIYIYIKSEQIQEYQIPHSHEYEGNIAL